MDEIGLSAFVKGGQQPGEEAIDLARFDRNPNTEKRLAALLDAPSHALPPMDVLAPAFLELLVCDSGSEPMST